MSNREYLTEKQAESLTLSDFTRAARRTLQELYETKSHFATNPPASDVLHLSPQDRRLLIGMKIQIEEGKRSRV
jgi:hypothetical protein